MVAERNGLPLPALRPSTRAHMIQIVAELLDPAVDSAPIRFQLCFARTSRADSASQPRHLNTVSGQAGQQIIQLRQLHLQLTFPRAGAPREYVQDQLRSIQDLAMERVLQIALLGGSEFGIEHHHVGLVAFHQAPQLVELTGPDQGSGIRRRPRLDDGFLDAGAGRVRQSLQLFERFFSAVRNVVRRAARARFQIQPDQNRAFLPSYRQMEAIPRSALRSPMALELPRRFAPPRAPLPDVRRSLHGTASKPPRSRSRA